MIDDLLAELRRRQIRLRVEGQRLSYEAPRGALTEELASRLRIHRPALMALCRQLQGEAPEDQEGHAAALSPIPIVARGKPLPLSFSQQRMWFLWKLAQESTAYCVPIVLRIRGPLDPAVLMQAFELLSSRHETLRTRIVEVAGQPFQTVHELPLDAQVVDLSANGGSHEAWIRIRADMDATVDLGHRIPFQLRLFRTGEHDHLLLIRLHHIIFDGGSNQLLMRELWPAYLALSQGHAPELPRLPIQYADFAAWQHQRLSGPLRDRLLAYWTHRLGGEPASLNLPRVAGAGPSPGMEAAEVRFTVSTALRTRLAELGLRHGATMFMTLVTALRVLLFRYGGERDFLIGTPTIRRFHPDTESLIGYFGNTLLLRNPLQAGESYLDALAREREAALSAYQHQELPFDLVVQALSRHRRPGASPLFQVMFLFGESAPAVYPAGPLQIEFLETPTNRAKFDLGVWIKQLPNGGLSGHFEYACSQFDRVTIERMSSHFQRILHTLAHDPASSIDATILLDDQEAETQLRVWNQTARPVDERPVHAQFAARAAQCPEAVAVLFGEQRVSYGSLERQVRVMCSRLRSAGVRPGDRVLVCLARTPALIATLLGIQRAGAAYVPVDPAYPAERALFILNDSGAGVLVADPSESPWWRGRNVRRVDAQGLADTAPAPGESMDPETPWVDGDSVSHILYTSGSTGRPKGVEITHAGVTGLVAWALDTFPATALKGVLAATSVCFDLSVFELYVPLCGGHSVVLAPSPMALDALPARDAVTLINTVPSVMRALLAAGTAFPRSLRAVCLAGEPLATDLVDEVYRRTGVTEVYDLYGPTEATTYATWQLRVPGAPASIGRPISNTRAYVLDEAGLPVPVGVAGELYLAGRSLARGYLGQPERTAARFAAPRAACIPEVRLYRTGDIARHMPGGELQYLGRQDDQLKIRGFRIEPGEVRTALLAVEGVDDALVVGRIDAGGTQILVAYVIGDPAASEPERLKAALSAHLPTYMVPSVFVRVEAFPLNVNGKIDPRRLPPVPLDSPEPASRPLTPTEHVVACIWQDVLGRAITVDTNFFGAGGTSLSAMVVVGRVNAHLDIAVPLRALFEQSDLVTFAGVVDSACRHAPPPTPIPMPRADLGENLPVTLLQRHLLQVHRVAENPAFLNLWKTVWLDEDVSAAQMQQQLDGLTQRHPILRARFPAQGRGRLQRLDAGTPALATADLTRIQDPDERRRQRGTFCYALGAPFDLDNGPCCRFGLIRTAGERPLLIIVIHHALVDEWSLDHLAKDLVTALAASRSGLPVPATPEGALNFADYAVRERHDRATDRHEAQLAWWTATLRPPLARLRLPFDPPDASAAKPGTWDFPIPFALWTSLEAAAAARHTSMFTVSMAVLMMLVARLADESDIRVCTNVSRRHRRDFGTTVGPLTDSLLIRTHLPTTLSMAQAVPKVRDCLLATFERLDPPFEEIATRVTATHEVPRQSLAQIFFLLQESDIAPASADTAGDLGCDPQRRPDYFSGALHEYDLIFYVRRQGQDVHAQLSLAGGAPEFAQAYVAALGELAADWGVAA